MFPKNKYGRFGLVALYIALAFTPTYLILRAQAAEPIVVSTDAPRSFWTRVFDFREKEDQSELRRDMLLEETIGKRLWIEGSVIDVGQFGTGEYRTCHIRMRVEQKLQEYKIQQTVKMPCKGAEMLVKSQKLFTICVLNGEWDYEQRIPKFDICKLQVGGN